MTATISTLPRVRPIVEIGVGDERDAEGVVALWQLDANNDNVPDIAGFVESRWQAPTGGDDAATSHWVGDQPFFVDVSCHAREVSTFSGRERANENWEVGTATIVLDNADGWADYPRTADPNQLLTMRPGRQVRVGVELLYGSTVGIVYLWGGYVDGMEPGFDSEDGEFVTLECIDGKGEAGRSFVGELAAGVGAGETVSARIGRVLNAVAWFTNRRSIQAASVTLKATAFNAQAVDLMNLAADSAGGAVFGDVNGNVAFRGRDWQAVSSAQPPDGTIGNFGDPGEACAVNWEQSFNREDISTKVVIGRPNTVPMTKVDQAAFRLYGEETFERTDLETNLDSDLAILRDRILDVRNVSHMPRIAAVTLDASTSDEALDVMAKVSPYKPSFVRCRHKGDGGRVVFNNMMMVVGVEHTLTPDGWQARVALDNAKPFQIGANDGRWSDGTTATGYWQPTEPTAPTPPAFITRWSEGV